MSVPRGTATIGVSVLGVSGIRAALRPLLEPELTDALDRGNRAAARALAKRVRAEVAKSSPTVARAVRVKRARTGKPGWVVGSRRRGVGFVFPFIVGGTSDHGPLRAKRLVFIPGWNPYLGASAPAKRLSGKAGDRLVMVARVRGVRASDSVAVAAAAGESEAVRAAEQSFAQSARL